MRKRRLLSCGGVVLALLLLSTGTALGASAGLGWTTETVDDGEDVGWSTDIAVDGADNPHISYTDHSDNALKYAYWDGSAWNLTTVEDGVGNDTGRHTSIVLDGSGYAHISYVDYDSGYLKYATNGTGSWVTTIVDNAGNDFMHTSIALDASGDPCIAYYDDTTQNLKYADSSGGWTTGTVESGGEVGSFCSLAIDSSNNAHISYYDETNYALRYATGTLGSWTTTGLDDPGPASPDVGRYTSIGLDTSENPYISYYDVTNGDLKFIYWTGAAWSTPASIDTTNDVGKYSSLAMKGDTPVIVYYDATNGRIRYAELATGPGPGFVSYWQFENVDTGNVGWYGSVAVDSSGFPLVAYYDYTNDDLMYARGTPEPGTALLGLLALSFGGVFAARRKKKESEADAA